MHHLLPVIAAENDAVYDFLLGLTDREALAVLLRNSLPTVLRVLAIIVVAWVLNRILRRAIRRAIRRLAAEGGLSRLGALSHRGLLADTTSMDLGRATMRAETIAGVMRSLTTVAVWAVAVIMVLGEFAVSLGPLIAGAGIVGVALGFGAQKLVQDFLSGIFMLVEDQYGIGDIVDAGEAVGVIEAITLRTTRLRDLEGTVWHIPNGSIARIGNMSQEWARALLDVGVAYDTHLPTAIDTVKRTADEVWSDPDWSMLVLDEPEVWGVEDFGSSEITIRLVVKTRPGEQWKVSREIRKRLKPAFDAEGIEIPFPQRTMWMRDDNGDRPSPTAGLGGPAQPSAQERAAHRSSPQDYPAGPEVPEGDGGEEA